MGEVERNNEFCSQDVPPLIPRRHFHFPAFGKNPYFSICPVPVLQFKSPPFFKAHKCFPFRNTGVCPHPPLSGYLFLFIPVWGTITSFDLVSIPCALLLSREHTVHLVPDLWHLESCCWIFMLVISEVSTSDLEYHWSSGTSCWAPWKKEIILPIMITVNNNHHLGLKVSFLFKHHLFFFF